VGGGGPGAPQPRPNSPGETCAMNATHHALDLPWRADRMQEFQELLTRRFFSPGHKAAGRIKQQQGAGHTQKAEDTSWE